MFSTVYNYICTIQNIFSRNFINFLVKKELILLSSFYFLNYHKFLI